MSLIDSMMEECVMLDKVSVSDGLGGFTYEWAEGAHFMAAVIKNSEPAVIAAEMQGVTEQFTVVVHTGISLQFHDAFKRLSDESVFRVTGEIKDNQAPAASTVKIAKVRAERWVVPG